MKLKLNKWGRKRLKTIKENLKNGMNNYWATCPQWERGLYGQKIPEHLIKYINKVEKTEYILIAPECSVCETIFPKLRKNHDCPCNEYTLRHIIKIINKILGEIDI